MERFTEFAFVNLGTVKTENDCNQNFMIMKCEDISDVESDGVPKKQSSCDVSKDGQESTQLEDSIPNNTGDNNGLYFQDSKTSESIELQEEKWCVKDAILLPYSSSYSAYTEKQENLKNYADGPLVSFTESHNENGNEKSFTELLPLVMSSPKDLQIHRTIDPLEKVADKNSVEISNIKVSLSLQKELDLEADCNIILNSEESSDDTKENIVTNVEHVMNIKDNTLTNYKEAESEVTDNASGVTKICSIKRGRGRPRVLVKKTHPCSVCFKVFSRKTHLTTHLRIHSDEKPYMCTLCGKRFRDNSVLIKHIRVHTQDKPYVCSVCSKAFNQKGNMERHARQHTNEKPFICLFCQNAFSNKSHLQRHFRIHVDEKPFTCELCDKSFRQKSHLMRHVLVHSREKPYSCNLCNKRFRQEQHVSRHKKTHIKYMITNILLKNCISKSTPGEYV